MNIFSHNAASFDIVSDNPRQRSRVPVLIKVLDVNDNAPEFAMLYETLVCENVRAGQVMGHHFVFAECVYVCLLPLYNNYTSLFCFEIFDMNEYRHV